MKVQLIWRYIFLTAHHALVYSEVAGHLQGCQAEQANRSIDKRP